MRDPLTKPTSLRLFKRMLLTTTPYGGMIFEQELLFSTAMAQLMGF